jgi:iron-sulfur cluster assembly protein
LDRIRNLQTDATEPRYLRIGVKNKGCSGLEYALDYVDKKGKFDEEVKQDGGN